MVAESSYPHALAALRRALGAEADFRDGQWDAVKSVIQPGARSLVVQRTGWGKSLVYFLATRLLREKKAGPTLLVSPLLSLMRNQIDLASRFNLVAYNLDSTNREMWPEIEEAIQENRADILLISPERLGNPEFKDRLLPLIESKTGLLVIDEAHCISDWGHDFRPDYRRILSSVDRLNNKASILATTATANNRVIDDIREQLGDSLHIVRGPLVRESLCIRVLQLSDPAERLAWMAQYIPKIEGSGIVYTLTVHDAVRAAEFLSSEGINAQAYFAGLPNEERIRIEQGFQQNEIKVLCATTALGMGYDKSDVAFVVHFQRPGSIIAYYQQIGRAGRSLDRAEVILLEGHEDDAITEYFIDSAFPEAEVFSELKEVMKDDLLPSLESITSRTNFRHSKIEKALKLLEVEGAVERTSQGYRWVNQDWDYDSLRAVEISGIRRRELAQMQEFTTTNTCRMEFLARALDDPMASPCGKCDNCRDLVRPAPARELVERASTFLLNDPQEIICPTFFPTGFEGSLNRKKIPGDLRHVPGVALCVYNETGWGRRVKEGKYGEDDFDPELIKLCQQALEKSGFQVDWITWIPSHRRVAVERFARKLAERLKVPAKAAVRKARANEEQKRMQNSSRQLGNVWDAFEVDMDQIERGNCLLFDDIVDSGWTLAAAGIKLRKAGVNSVFPLTLATARPRKK